MELANLSKLNAARRQRKAVVQITELGHGSDQVFVEGEPAFEGVLGDAVSSALRSGKSGVIEAEGRSFFLNVHLPPARIVVIGAVHISQTLARMAELAGFDIRIIDPRTAFATPERFEGVDLVADWPVDVLKDHPLDAYTALVAVTHDPKIDDFPIAEALRTGCFYIGALGSKKTHAKRVERLLAEGITEAELVSIHAPIGLPIGASSPAEIAVAILAQIIQALRTRDVSTTKAILS
ncbi:MULTISPECIES: XdhC family protein [unclassified Sinorhizobium]|uniref:XdhC family protein n=1 Tax=unclassified Sinorhizobium TaxID=2613772 RepID=UPI00352327E2